MSTNFYWIVQPARVHGTGESIMPRNDDPSIHIGRLHDHGTEVEFEWAQQPVDVRRHCERHKQAADATIIRDSNGRLYTGARFIEEVLDRVEVDWPQNIGKWFT